MKMVGKLFLSGGGSAKQSFKVDEIFLDGIEKILYIPLARNGNFDECFSWISNAIGIHKMMEIDMLTDLSKKISLSDYDAVYIGGGNTYRLLKTIRESGFDKKLINYYRSGGIVYGGSAGAIILGRDIEISSRGIDADENKVNLKNTRGFNLIKGFDIQCHYRSHQLKKQRDYAIKTGVPIIAIPEGSAILVQNGEYRVVGTKSLTVINKEGAEKFPPGRRLEI